MSDTWVPVIAAPDESVGPLGPRGPVGPAGAPGGPEGPPGPPPTVHIGDVPPQDVEDTGVILWVDTSVADQIGGDGFPTRVTLTLNTGSLAAGDTLDTTVELAGGYRLLCIATDSPARVRVYYSDGARAADASRPVGTDPTPPHGLIAEVVTTAELLDVWLNPAVYGYTTDGTAAVPIAVTNTGAGPAAVNVTFTWVKSETNAVEEEEVMPT